MPFAVNVHFDPASERKVEEIWKRIAEENISSEMLDRDVRAHLTLCVVDEIDRDELAVLLAGAADGVGRIGLRFDHVGAFPGRRGVSFLGITPTQELLALHRRIVAGIAPAVRGPWPLYLPDRWVPHCSLTMHLDPDRVPDVLRVALASLEPFEGMGISFGVADVASGAVLIDLPAAGASETVSG